MKTVSLVCLIAAAMVAWPVLSFSAESAEPTAEQLIAKVLEAQKTSGFRVRAKLIVVQTGSTERRSCQLLIKGIRQGESSKLLYQVLWPTNLKGQALVIERSADHKSSGFWFVPPETVTPLSAELLARPFLESDLTIEDLTEDFWNWPVQKIVGEEVISMKPCKIIESRPAEGATGSYSRVRSWICPEIALPLRIEKFGKEGALVKSIKAEKFFKEDDRWVIATVVVEPADGHQRTTLDGSKAERNLEISPEEFSLQKIKSFIQSSP